MSALKSLVMAGEGVSEAPSCVPAGQLSAESLLAWGGHRGAVAALAWSPDGERLASASHDRTVQVWGSASGASLFSWDEHAGRVRALAWSPDGERLASGGDGAEVHLWRQGCAGGGQWVRCPCPGGTSALSWSPDGSRFASGGDDGLVRIWDAVGGTLVSTFGPYARPVVALAWSPDGERLASCSWDAVVCVWEGATGRCLFTYRYAPRSTTGLAWSPDGERLAVSLLSHEGAVDFWEPAGGGGWQSASLARKGSLSGPFGFQAVAFSPDGRHVATGQTLPGRVQIWAAVSLELQCSPGGHLSAVLALAWAPDSARLASGGLDGIVRVYGLSSCGGTSAAALLPSGNE